MLGLGISGATAAGTLMGGRRDWWQDGAVLDADFANGRYRHDGEDALDPLGFVTVSRAAPSLSYAESNGALVGFAAHAPRITTKGLLVEGPARNLVKQSQTFGTTWTTNAATTAGASGLAPDGSNTASRLVADGTSDIHLIQQAGVTVSASGHTVSAYFKADGYHKVGVREGAIVGAWAAFDLRGDGAILGAGGGGQGIIHRMADGWYRVAMTYTATAHDHIYQLFLLDADYAGGSLLDAGFQGDGVRGALVWGVQVEAGGMATSYIPTTTSSVLRNADVIGLTGAAALAVTGAACTILAVTPPQGHPAEGGARILGTDGPVPLNTGSDSEAQNYNGTDFVTASVEFSARYSLDEVWSMTAWSASGTSVVANGGAISAAGSAMASISTGFVGSSNGGNALNGYIKRLVLWNHAKSNDAMRTISAAGQSFDPRAIIAWGDSLTSGNQDGSGMTWPWQLSSLLGAPVYNRGVGGETSAQILARFLAFPSGYSSRSIIGMGRNDFADAVAVTANIAEAVEALASDDFLVLSILPSATDSSAQKAGIAALNAALSAAYGPRFVDVLSLLPGNGEALDASDLDAGHVPRSLRTPGDPIHLNAAGYSAMAAGIRAAMVTNSW